MALTPLTAGSPKGGLGNARRQNLLLLVAAAFLVIFIVALRNPFSTADIAGEVPRKDRSLQEKALELQNMDERREYLAAVSFSKICFSHVPKTGGTNFAATGAFKAVFDVQRLKKNLEKVGKLEEFGDLAKPVLGDQVNYANIGHRQDPRDCMNGKVITIIRDPMERIVSAYKNSKATAETCDLDKTDWSAGIGTEAYALTCDCCGVLHFPELVKKMREHKAGLLHFLDERHMPKNQVSKQLLGWSITLYCDDVDKEVFNARQATCRDMIRSRLLDHFILVGFSEHYESFKEQFVELFDVGFASVADQGQVVWEGRKAIVGAAYDGLPHVVHTLRDDEQERLWEWTRVDRMLYEEAIKIWQPAAIGKEPWRGID